MRVLVPLQQLLLLKKKNISICNASFFFPLSFVKYVKRL